MRKYAMFLCLILISFVALANQIQQGKASYYSSKFVGNKTANGEIYSHEKLTCAHRTLPFGTKLKVVNIKNNKSVIVTVNDRGPFSDSRIIDLSKSAAQQLDFISHGVADVTLEIIH